MTPVEFKEQNCTYAKDQPEYIPLPAFRDDQGRVISCWKLTPEEIAKISETGIIWVSLLTFNQPLQPIRLDVDNPFEEPKK
jgi:hypothetical protein